MREPDQVTKGALTAEQLHLLLRPDLDAKPRTDDIAAALSLLESPYLQAVHKNGAEYRLSEPASATARRFRILANVFRE